MFITDTKTVSTSTDTQRSLDRLLGGSLKRVIHTLEVSKDKKKKREPFHMPGQTILTAWSKVQQEKRTTKENGKHLQKAIRKVFRLRCTYKYNRS